MSDSNTPYTPDEAWMIRAEYERHFKHKPQAKEETVVKLIAHRLGARRLGAGRYRLSDIPEMEAVVLQVLTDA